MRTRNMEADVGDKRVAQTSGGQVRKVIRKVVVTYRPEDDPEGADRTFTLEHEGEGEIVDALVWNAPLMKKLGYVEADGACTPVRTETGKGWTLKTGSARTLSLSSAAETNGDEGNCIWFHRHTCTWEEFCSPE